MEEEGVWEEKGNGDDSEDASRCHPNKAHSWIRVKSVLDQGLV